VVIGIYLPNALAISLVRNSEHVSGAENGAERTENRRERSGAVSGLNLPLKIRSTVKALNVKILKSIF